MELSTFELFFVSWKLMMNIRKVDIFYIMYG